MMQQQQNLPNMQQFELILKNILSPKNDIRNQAEAHFQKAKQYPQYCIESLIKIIKFSKDLSVRSLACILLRKCVVVAKDTLYTKLNPSTKQGLKKELLGILYNEKNEAISKKLGYAICGLASGLILPQKNDFPELIPTLFKWSTNDAPLSLRITSLRMFGHLSTYLQENGFGGDVVNKILIILKDGLSHRNPKLRFEAFLTATSVILILNKKNMRAFTELVPFQLQCIGGCLNDKDFEHAGDLLQSFIEIGMMKPKFFKEGLRNIMSALYKITRSSSIPMNIRHLAIENINTLIEGVPSIVRDQLPKFIENMFPLCLNLMLSVKHEKRWEVEEFKEDDIVDSELTNYDVGVETLDRLSIALGGQMIQPVAFKYIPMFLGKKDDWRYRHAGLMCISQTAEGCVNQYEPHLERLINFCLVLIKDEHPRVRYAAVHCLAQLSTDFVHTLQSKYHAKVAPGIILGMQDSVPKVQAHAATAVVNFVDECDVNNVKPYMDNIMSCLLNLLHKPTRFVQVQCLSAISAVADCARGLFVKYYSNVMRYLKSILKDAKGKENRMLRARAIECVSLIGVSVGPDVFNNDAKYILDLFSYLQTQPMQPDDPQINCLLQGWSRLARILGHSFIPYLDFVMKPLLAQASLKPQVIITDADESQSSNEDGMESVTISIKGIGDKRISIKTSVLEEKSLACNMLLSYVSNLKDGFYKYAATVTQLMVPLLKFAYLDDIRETAGTIMPELLECVKLSIEKGKVSNDGSVQKMLHFMFDTLLDAIKIETELKTALILTQGLHDSIKVCGRECLSPKQLEKVSIVLGQTIVNSIMKKNECNEVLRKIDNNDESIEFEYLEEEIVELRDTVALHDDFISTLTEVVGILLKTHGTYLAYLGKHMWPIYLKMLDPNLPDNDNRIALCLLCDIIEHSKTHPTQIFNPKIISLVLNYSKGENPDVRQAGVYALGAGAQFFSSDFFAKISKPTIGILINAIDGNDTRKKEMMAARCNAVSALFKVVKFQSKNVDHTQLLNIWFQSLPVGGDIIEAQIVHSHLVKLIQMNNTIILGEGNKNLPKIIHILSQILFTPLVDEKLQVEIFALIKQIKGALPQNLFSQTMQQLTEAQRNAIGRALGN